MRKNRPAVNYASYSFLHTVEGGERLDTISNDYYGNPGMWKVIADANVLSSIDGLKPAITLRIP